MATRRTQGRPQDIDRLVGSRMRARRLALGISLQQIAAVIGVTYQQAHKYEVAADRITTGRLYHAAVALGVDVGFFFDDTDAKSGLASNPQGRLLLDLARSFVAVQDRRHQEAICDLARALAEDGADRAPSTRSRQPHGRERE